MSDLVPDADRPRATDAAARLRPQGIVHVIGWSVAIGAIPPLVHNGFGGHWAALAILLVTEAGAVSALALNRRGRVGAAVAVLLASVEACAGGLVLVSGLGLRAVAVMLFPATLVVAGLLLERTAFAVVTFATVAFTVAIGAAEIRGLIVTQWSGFTLAPRVADSAVILAVTGIAVGLLAESVRASLTRARQHEASLEAVNEELLKQSLRAQASEERFRSLIDLAVDGILVGNAEGRLIGVNRRMRELTGFSGEELLGRPLRELFSREEMRRTPLRYDLVAAGDTVVNERLLLRKDGTTVPVEMSSKRMPDGTYHSFFRDITERRRAAEEGARLRDELRHAQKMEAVGRLAGGIAHDFNNMLMVIASSVAVALRDVEEGSRIRRCLTEVEAAGERAAALTRQLLAFSRREPIAPRLLDPGDLVANLEPMVAGILGDEVSLEIIAPRRLGIVRADAGLLEQAILNLAMNARDAMPGGGHLALTLAEDDLDEEEAKALGLTPGPHVSLSVSDNGTGMPDEVRQHLFEPFFTTKPSGKGTGLGLAMVYGAVKQSGGGIGVETRLGRGTTFRLLLPRVDAARERGHHAENLLTPGAFVRYK
jgi:two-component system cell cycle sensor histidine kinase/response regulator CckA